MHGGPLNVVEGVGRDELRAGPGHHPHAGAPGDPGNLAVAGHRTSYGAHFGRLDELARGDLVHVTDHAGRRWTYAVAGHRIVDPGAWWVLATDPLRTGADTGTMTLTTCHPKWSAAQRLIVFARLTAAPTVDEPPTLRSPG